MKYVFIAFCLVFSHLTEAQTAFQFVQMANQKMEEGNSLGAVKDYTSAVQADGLYAPAFLGRGSVYAELNLFTEALLDLNKALQLDSALADVYFNRAYVYVQQNSFEAALAEYNQYLAMNPMDAQGYLARAELAKLTGAPAQTDYLKYIELSNQSFEDKLIQSGVYLYLADTLEAIACLDECIRMRPEAAEVYQRRGELFVQTGRYTDALRDLSTALIIEEEAGTYFERALIYAEIGEYAMAFADCRQAVDLEPENSEIQFNAGVYGMEVSDFDNASRYFEKAAQLKFVDRASLNYNLGLCYFNQGKREQACSTWQNAEGAASELILQYCNQN